MEKVLVVGLNNFGTEIARTLANDFDVTAADYQKDKLASIKESVRRVLLLSKDRPEQLDELNYSHVSSVIVVVGEDLFFSMATVLILKRLEAKNIYVCVENEDQANLIGLLGDLTIIRSDVQITKAVQEELSSTFNN